MITRLSIFFEDLVASSIAPQVMPPGFTDTFLLSDDFVHYHDGVLYKFRYCEISGEKGEF